MKEIDNTLQTIFAGEQHYSINGVAIDSTQVGDGYAFICIEGSVTDGHKYAEDAVKRGASLVVAQHPIDNLDKLKEKGYQFDVAIVDDTHKAASEIACQYWGYPSRNMKVVGITGTNGKTTTSNIVSHVLQVSGLKTAIIGTTGIFINGKPADENKYKFAGRTTPDSISIQQLFSNLLDDKVQAVVMEVSSHALDQKRVWGINFDVCAFTNLTQDHLDYHKTMGAYFQAKSLLFGPEYSGTNIVCIDDEWGKKLASQVAGDIIEGKLKQNQGLTTVGLNPKANFCSENFEADFPLTGKFNEQNMLVAVGICEDLGISQEDIKSALKTTPQVDGRMQIVNKQSDKKNPCVVVDYAHTPDALYKACETLDEIKTGKLITVFGCGGDRDKQKRPLMAEAASRFSDLTIVTTDNPRTENPEKIIEEIVAGICLCTDYKVISDRAQAIKWAIENATTGDIVLIAGKGHEDYQEINGEKIHFDDREHAWSALYK